VTTSAVFREPPELALPERSVPQALILLGQAEFGPEPARFRTGGDPPPKGTTRLDDPESIRRALRAARPQTYTLTHKLSDAADADGE
jgi:hypothetical protein